jgi:hypothetical protein
LPLKTFSLLALVRLHQRQQLIILLLLVVAAVVDCVAAGLVLVDLEQQHPLQ